MQVGGVLVTHNSDHHPPETWATATAGMIFSVDNETPPDRKIPALEFQAKLARVLVDHHRQVQDAEAGKLDADPARVDADHSDVVEHVEPAIAAVNELAAGSPFAEMFAKPEVQARLREVLASHFTTAQHLHRRAFAAKRRA